MACQFHTSARPKKEQLTLLISLSQISTLLCGSQSTMRAPYPITPAFLAGDAMLDMMMVALIDFSGLVMECATSASYTSISQSRASVKPWVP